MLEHAPRAHANTRVLRALFDERLKQAEVYYDSICTLTRPDDSGEYTPVVFWRKWFDTPGIQFGRSRFRSVDPVRVEGEHIVLVDALAQSTNYLTDGIERFATRHPARICVITPRIQFTDDELGCIARHVALVLVSHSYQAHEERINRFCPGIFARL